MIAQSPQFSKSLFQVTRYQQTVSCSGIRILGQKWWKAPLHQTSGRSGRNLLCIFSSFHLLLDRVCFCTPWPPRLSTMRKEYLRKRAQLVIEVLAFYHIGPFLCQVNKHWLSVSWGTLLSSLLISSEVQPWLVYKHHDASSIWTTWAFPAGGKAHVKSFCVSFSSWQTKFLSKVLSKGLMLSHLLQNPLAFPLTHRKYLEASTVSTPSSAIIGCCSFWTSSEGNQVPGSGSSKIQGIQIKLPGSFWEHSDLVECGELRGRSHRSLKLSLQKSILPSLLSHKAPSYMVEEGVMVSRQQN